MISINSSQNFLSLSKGRMAAHLRFMSYILVIKLIVCGMGDTVPFLTKSKNKDQHKEKIRQRKEELRSRSVADQFKQDAKVWQTWLSSSHKTSVSEDRKNIAKRLFMALDAGELQYRNEEEKKFQSIATMNDKIARIDNKIPLASILSHGGRVVIEIPPLKEGRKKDELLDWVIGGNENNAKVYTNVSILTKDVNSRAEKFDKPVFQRSAATHSLKVGEDGHVHELKTNIGSHTSQFIGDLKITNQESEIRHLGMNTGLDTDGPENGSFGHLYMYWLPPTQTTPGALMVGCEGSEPGKKNKFGELHDSRAISSDFSPTDGLKFRHLKDSPFHPAKVDGLRICLDQTQLDQLLKKKVFSFDMEKLSIPVGTLTQNERQEKFAQLPRRERVPSPISPERDAIARSDQITPPSIHGPVRTEPIPSPSQPPNKILATVNIFEALSKQYTNESTQKFILTYQRQLKSNIEHTKEKKPDQPSTPSPSMQDSSLEPSDKVRVRQRK